MSDRLHLRQAVNVPDALDRNRLVQRVAAVRREAEQSKADIEHWNQVHPDKPPLDTAFEDAVIAWCDGRGPLPFDVPRP